MFQSSAGQGCYMSSQCSALPLKSTSQGFAANSLWSQLSPKPGTSVLGHGCCGDGERHVADTIAVCTSSGGGGHEEGEAAGRDEERLEKQNLQEARGAGGSPGSEGLGRGEGSGCPGGAMGEGQSPVAFTARQAPAKPTHAPCDGDGAAGGTCPGSVPPGRLSPSAATRAAHAPTLSKED